jgi:hypothetical protein
MTLKICWDLVADFELRDNGFEEILEQKIIYSETGGMCWHHFLEK